MWPNPPRFSIASTTTARFGPKGTSPMWPAIVVDIFRCYRATHTHTQKAKKRANARAPALTGDSFFSLSPSGGLAGYQRRSPPPVLPKKKAFHQNVRKQNLSPSEINHRLSIRRGRNGKRDNLGRANLDRTSRCAQAVVKSVQTWHGEEARRACVLNVLFSCQPASSSSSSIRFFVPFRNEANLVLYGHPAGHQAAKKFGTARGAVGRGRRLGEEGLRPSMRRAGFSGFDLRSGLPSESS